MEKILKRSEVELEKTWDLTTIFENDEKWESEFEKLSSDIQEITKYENIMTDSLENFKNTIFLDEKLSLRLNTLYTYAHLKGDEDISNTKYQEYNGKMVQLYSKYSSLTTFIKIKILEMPEDILNEYLEDSELKIHKFDMKNLLESKKHILSQKEETLLSEMGPLVNVSSKAFSMLNNVDIKFDPAVNEKGENLTMSHSRYSTYLESTDKVLRKSAYDSMYNAYKGLKNIFATILEGNTKNHVINAKIRNYESARHSALSNNFIDETVYDNLLKAVNEKLPLLHRYMDLRKKMLNLEELHMYDLLVPIVKDIDLKFTYEESKEIILDALKVLGEDYVSVVKRAFDERWIDYAENEGKRSGAYSSGSYLTNPYILISYKGTIDNLFTLIHELGHSMHSYYTRKNQPYVYGYYTIFLAEVASITNEMILTEYLLEKYKNDDKIKAYILNHYLDSVRATLFRQTQFAEFEYEIHKILEKGGILTADTLSNLYYDINKKYYGDVVTYDDNIRYEWARIPHFYYNFYVYQYATGISAASAFSKQILEGNKEDVDKYLSYLKAGSSDYSINILKKAGVDMSTNKPVYDCLEKFEEKLNELEKMLK